MGWKGQAEGVVVCTPAATHFPALSKPAIAWLSAKNSAGDREVRTSVLDLEAMVSEGLSSGRWGARTRTRIGRGGDPGGCVGRRRQPMVSDSGTSEEAGCTLRAASMGRTGGATRAGRGRTRADFFEPVRA